MPEKNLCYDFHKILDCQGKDLVNPISCPHCQNTFIPKELSLSKPQIICPHCSRTFEQIEQTQESSDIFNAKSYGKELDEKSLHVSDHIEAEFEKEFHSIENPWELSKENILKRFFSTCLLTLKKPHQFFRGITTASLDNSLSYGLIMLFFYNFFINGYSYLAVAYVAKNLNTLAEGSPFLAEQLRSYTAFFQEHETQGFEKLLQLIIQSMILPLFTLFGTTLIIQMLLVGSLGVTYKWRGTCKAVIYGYSPSLFAFIPLLGWVLAFFWTLYLQIVGLSVIHKISTKKAAFAVITPIIISIVTSIIVGISG